MHRSELDVVAVPLGREVPIEPAGEREREIFQAAVVRGRGRRHEADARGSAEIAGMNVVLDDIG